MLALALAMFLLFIARTFLSSSFSSFISFSLAFIVASATRSLARFSYEVSPEPGRKAFLGACHCLPSPSHPVRNQTMCHQRQAL